MTASSRTRGARFALGIPLFVVLVVGAAACNAIIGANEPALRGSDSSTAPPCVLNSDCTTTGQVCIFRVCSPPCHTDADCTDGSRCLQTPDATVCVANLVATCDAMQPCPTGSTCQAGACRNACGGSQRCLSQQECQAGVCVGVDPTHDPGLGALVSDASSDQSPGEGSRVGDDASEDADGTSAKGGVVDSTADASTTPDVGAPRADAAVTDSPCGNTITDPHNCGSCGHDCTALPHLSGPVTCGTSGQCVFAASSCAPGWAHCAANPDLGCETDISKPSNCGACGSVCPASAPVCSGSGSTYSCVTGCSGSTPSLCGGTCVDTATDPSNCATCMHSCGGVVHGQPKCAASVCTIACNSGYTDCSGACVDETSDDNNCNGCGKACAGGQHCTGGSCQCASGMRTCSGTCVANDVAACGPSCTMCASPTGGTVTCNGTSCVQACSVVGNVVCGTACVNESTDVNNCGTCTNKCAGTTPFCLNSGCVECMSGTTQCVNSTQQETCGPTGHWGTATTCTDACIGTGVGSMCGGMCVPGSTMCTSSSGYETCNSSGQYGPPTVACMANEVCRGSGCVNAVHDVGWDTALGGSYNLSSNFLYLFRLPQLAHSAKLLAFGAYGNSATGVNAELALYADNGSGTAPGGSTALAATSSPLLLANANAEQGASPANYALSANTTYWLGIVVQTPTTIYTQTDPTEVGTAFANPYGTIPWPAGTSGLGKSGFDLAIYINVQDTN